MCEWIFEVARDLKKKEHQLAEEGSHSQDDITLHTLLSSRQDSSCTIDDGCCQRGEAVDQPQAQEGELSTNKTEQKLTEDEQNLSHGDQDDVTQDSV